MLTKAKTTVLPRLAVVEKTLSHHIEAVKYFHYNMYVKEYTLFGLCKQRKKCYNSTR